MGYIAANNAASTLVASVTSSATTLSIQTADIAKFPVINQGGSGSDYTYLAIQDSANNIEIVKVTRHDSGSTSFTIVRGQDGTAAIAWSSGDSVAVRLNAGVVTDAFARTYAAEAAAVAAASSAAAAAASYDSFDDRWLGAKTSDPTTDNDGNALQDGAAYWNTSSESLRVYNGTAFQSVLLVNNFAVDVFTGNGTNTSFTLSQDPGTKNNTWVTVNEQLKTKSTYSVSGTTLTFGTAPANGAAIEVVSAATATIGVPADGSVATPKLADYAVTQIKLNAAFNLALTKAAGSFFKADPSTVVFTKTGNATASIKAGTIVPVNGSFIEFATATAITMPTLVSGTDYAIWVKPDGGIEATSNHTSPPVANARKSGGFHYGPGGHSGSPGGGNSTPQINAYSFWDLKFRPACPDPRGMALVADGFWSDIYLLGVDHLTNGTSKYNVTIADGSSPPKIPTKFGGNGTNAYGSLNWWEGMEVLRSHGKRAPTYSEFAALTYGTTEATSIGTDPGSTTWNATYISKWGMAQSTGNMWIWGDEFGGGAAAAAWTANTGGRGSTYQMEFAVRFGGDWANTSNSGSRASYWANSPTASDSSIGVRGVCDHLQLD